MAAVLAVAGHAQATRPSHPGGLTGRQVEVLRLLATGLSNPQIGERLFISRRTVQTHLMHVFAKLEISSRAQLAAEAARSGRRASLVSPRNMS